MTYELCFIKSAHKEWDNLAVPIRERFKRKLEERLNNPFVPKDKLSGMENCFKIKLRDIGYRLVYEVRDSKFVITVISVGKRDKMSVYKRAHSRLS